MALQKIPLVQSEGTKPKRSIKEKPGTPGILQEQGHPFSLQRAGGI